ncbi:FAD-binding oxidoreductase [Phyllobacterium chamaecytisi]|uniref:FAD-binding oxidoreductase n=1 Tax=Phyllobacterium chamaecytisi TaxID=2876082 RepID=UPI001CD03B63|nr:FAD-binding oxidoreductase [Phyllobacterium sp. KW56]MBZ9603238.1 FAD-binding oxidoreductase [Phyllobacterium sp. KW56]
MDVLAEFRALLGSAHILTGNDAAPYLTDWRGLYCGSALCVLRPATTEEVAKIVGLCADQDIAIVPQGGNTGLVGGAIPGEGQRAVVLSTTRMTTVRKFDPESNTVTVEAGCILQTLQDYCFERGRLFPLSLGAEGSCTIGGNLATNAGGSQVLRYGNARDLTLGLEVVTADGQVWDGLSGLRKDNTGYDLKSLFVGSEGTLGIITAATLKLFPLPRSKITALVALADLARAVVLLCRTQALLGSGLTAFEVMSGDCLRLVSNCFPNQRLPFEAGPADAPWFVLFELSSNEEQDRAQDSLETLLSEAFEAEEITDAVPASSVEQARALWHLRESIPLAQSERGKGIKCDIALPVSDIAAFVAEMGAELSHVFPGVCVMPFGHLGDGNLHYNIVPSEAFGEDEIQASHDRLYEMVHDAVHCRGGSISAEHGIGQLKRHELLRYKTPHELSMFRAIKSALDHSNILNPGKLI